MTMAIVSKKNISKYVVQLAAFDPVEIMKTALTMKTQTAMYDSSDIENASIVKSSPLSVILSFFIGYFASEALNYALNGQNIWEVIGKDIEDTLNSIGCNYSVTIILEEVKNYCISCGTCYDGNIEACPVQLPCATSQLIYDNCL